MDSYLTSSIKQFEYYKLLGDKTFEQVSFDGMQWQYNSESNSISIIVKHIAGNMASRWTNFLNEDGEKAWRERDQEFEASFPSKAALLDAWERGWNCLFNALRPLREEHMETIVYIRNQGHTVTEAINRQLCHYAYHVGQIVFIGKMLKGHQWNTLSIPKGHSLKYNQDKFNKEKAKGHFTDDL